jgi:hypothetical protein
MNDRGNIDLHRIESDGVMFEVSEHRNVATNVAQTPRSKFFPFDSRDHYRATIVPATINKSSPTAINVAEPQVIRDSAKIPCKLNLLKETGQI